MQYFEAESGLPERIGQVIGSIIAAIIYLFLFWLMIHQFA